MVSLHTRNQTWKPEIGGKFVSKCFSPFQKGGEYFPGFHVGVMPEIRNVMFVWVIKMIVMLFKAMAGVDGRLSPG